MAIENVVIAYLADISAVKRSVTQIANLNKQLAQKMGVDFSKGFNVISSELKKIQFDKQFKIKVEGEKGLKKVRGTISTFEKVVKTADGQLFKFTETIGRSSKGTTTLATSINKVVTAQKKLGSATNQATTKFSNLSNVNATFSTQLGSFGKVTKLVGTNLNQLSDNGSKVSKIFETTNGKFVQLTQTTKRLPSGVNQVTRSVKQLSKAQAQNARVVEGNKSATKNFTQNLKSLAGRALLTIPVWFALRRSIQLVFTTIKDGLTAIVDFDRALQKSKRNLQGSAESIEANFIILRKEVTKLSLETGKSVEDITNAFQKFATVGFDFETSLAGANSATKLSILLFGDATETANAFARSMRVLADNSDDAEPVSEQLAKIMALTAELYKTNAFELNELTASLERFAPAAKTAGFSAGEAVKFLSALSTAGLRGSKAGRLLSTSLTRLLTKTDELASSLGVKVNPEVDRTFDVFLRVLDVLQKTRSETGKVSPEFEKLVKSIFGLRSGLAVKGLIALRVNLQKVLGVTGDVGKFNSQFEEVNKTIFQLVAQFRNLNKEIGKAFVTGLVGGDDFRDSLERIVEFQNKVIKNAERIGKTLTISGLITFGDTNSLLKEVKKIDEETIEALINIIVGTKEAKDELKKQQNEILKNNEKLLKGLEGQLKRAEVERLIFEIETDIKLDTDKFTIGKSILVKAKKALEERLEDLEPLQPTIKLKLDGIEITTEQENKLIKAIIKDQLERLRLQGATESQLLKIEDRLIRQTDINDDIIAQKIRQLEIDRKITEEQKARVQFSSESAKLAKIATEEGIGIAKAISEVLNGQRDFNTFLRQGGVRAEILKDQFGDFVKNQELLKFFLGRGSGISIQENVGQRNFSPIRAQSQFELAKARIGLRQSTDQNKTAIEKNTASIQELTKRFLGFGVVTGTEVLQAREEANRLSRLANIQAIQQRIIPQAIATGIAPVTGTQTISINVNIDGKNLSLTGTPNQVRQLLEQAKPGISEIFEEQIEKTFDDIANNVNNKTTQDFNKGIENF